MLAPETVTFLEGGCALIVATVSGAGEPHATRAWGATLVSDDPPVVRLLLDADDATGIEHLTTTTRIAVTGGDVETLQSIQFKGTALGIEPATDADRTRSAEWRDDFFNSVTAVDGTPRELLEHLAPADIVACPVEVTELYNQTPGPGAGASLANESS